MNFYNLARKHSNWLWVIFALPYLYASPKDNESYQILVASNEMIAQYLTAGTLPMWSDLIALGVPFPLKTSWLYHPLVILYAWFGSGVATAIIFLFHLVVALVFMDKLSRFLSIKDPNGIMVMKGCFVLGSPLIMNLVNNYWPSVFMGYLFLPVIFYYLFKVLLGSDQKVVHAISLGSFWGWSGLLGHPGCFVLNSLIIIIAGVALAASQKNLTLLIWCALSGLLAFTIMGHHIIGVMEEVYKFPVSIPRNTEEPLNIFYQFISSIIGPYWAWTGMAKYSRYLFAGPFFFLFFYFSLKWKNLSRLEKSFMFTCFSGLLILFLPIHKIFPLVSSTRYIKDGLIFFIILTMVYLIHNQFISKRLRAYLYIVQLVFHLVFFFFSATDYTFLKPKKGSLMEIYKNERHEYREEIFNTLEEFRGRNVMNSKLFFQLRENLGFMGFSHGTLQSYGFHSMNYQHLKGISLDLLYPSSTLPYGTFHHMDHLLHDTFYLKFLGVKNIVSLVSNNTRPKYKAFKEIKVNDENKIRLYSFPENELSAYTPLRYNPQKISDFKDRCRLKSILCLTGIELKKILTIRESSIVTNYNKISINLNTPLLPGEEIVIPYMYLQNFKALENVLVNSFLGSFIKITNLSRKTYKEIQLEYHSSMSWLYRINYIFICLIFCYFIYEFILLLGIRKK
jgi:hypothetical protein